MTKKELKARVSRGVKFLNNAYGPSWKRRIDTEQLALESGCFCILGQLEGCLSIGLDRLNLDERQAVNYGFMLSDKEYDSKPFLYLKLTEIWREEIQKT